LANLAYFKGVLVIGELIASCFANGIREFVVCAGARNAGLVAGLLREEAAQAGLEDGEEMKVWHHFEERSAGFFALGRTVATGEGCAVVTTSGTAVAELLPAVVEAHYQRRPLVVISADRPSRFRGSGAPQVIDQVGIFGDYVTGCGEISAEGGSDRVNASFDGWCGTTPWQVNVEIEEGDVLGEVSLVGDVQPVERQAWRADVGELARFLREDLFRGLIVMVGGLRPEEREEVYHFLKELKVPVIADATSGLREALGGLVLREGAATLKERMPGKVLRIGEVPVGRFWRDLDESERGKAVEVLNVCQSGLVQGEVDRVLRGLGEVEAIGDAWDWLKGNGKEEAVVEELLQAYPESEPAMMRLVSVFASAGESAYLGNSLPIRLWNQFAQREVPVTEVRANRGANGIDGQVSSWLGATADELGAWGIFGDLTGLYDLAGPAILEQVEQEGRVLVVMNNGGGRIFERLPRLKGFSAEEMEVVTNEHELDFAGWAQLWGMDYLCVDSVEGFDDFEPQERTILVEVVPNVEESRAFWAAYDGR